MLPAVRRRTPPYAFRSAHDDVGQAWLGRAILGFTDLEHGLPVADGGLALLQTAHDGLQPPSRHGSSKARVEFRDGFNCDAVARTGMKRMWRTAALRLSTNATESGAKKASTVS